MFIIQLQHQIPKRHKMAAELVENCHQGTFFSTWKPWQFFRGFLSPSHPPKKNSLNCTAAAEASFRLRRCVIFNGWAVQTKDEMLPGQGVCLHEHTLVSSSQWDFSFSASNGKETQHVNGAFNAAGLEVYLHSHVARQTSTRIIKRKF